VVALLLFMMGSVCWVAGCGKSSFPAGASKVVVVVAGGEVTEEEEEEEEEVGEEVGEEEEEEVGEEVVSCEGCCSADEGAVRRRGSEGGAGEELIAADRELD